METSPAACPVDNLQKLKIIYENSNVTMFDDDNDINNDINNEKKLDQDSAM